MASRAGRGPTGRHGSVAVLFGGIVVAVLLLAIPGRVGSPPTVAAGFTTLLSHVTNGTCNPWNPSPSALAIRAANPDGGHVNDSLNATYEFRVVNYTAGDLGIRVYFPAGTAVFPQKLTPPLKVGIVAKSLPITGSGWSAADLRTASLKLTTAPSFSRTQSAYLTTTKIAVMAGASYGNLTLEVRWQWSVHHALAGTTKTGHWTVPSLNSTGSFLPSIFYPAPWVGIVSTSGASAPGGTIYQILLNGSVVNTWFRIVLEFPTNGTNLHSIYENTTSAPTFNATMPLTYPNGTAVRPGPYLIHVHDHCEAIVHLLTVTAT